MRPIRLPIAAIALVVAGVAAACGGDDEGQGGGTTTAPQQAGTTVEVDEFSISPDELTVLSGDTLEVENVGSQAHNLTIERGPDPSRRTEKLAGTSTFDGGGSERLRVSVEPGRYALVCTVPGHREAGMTGTIAVGG
jgi:plastocyanin